MLATVNAVPKKFFVISQVAAKLSCNPGMRISAMSRSRSGRAA